MNSRCRSVAGTIGSLHQAGNEVAWWDNQKLNALEIARALWEQTRFLKPADLPNADN